MTGMVRFKTSCVSNSNGEFVSAYASAETRVRVKMAIIKRFIFSGFVTGAGAVYGLREYYVSDSSSLER